MGLAVKDPLHRAVDLLWNKQTIRPERVVVVHRFAIGTALRGVIKTHSANFHAHVCQLPLHRS